MKLGASLIPIIEKNMSRLSQYVLPGIHILAQIEHPAASEIILKFGSDRDADVRRQVARYLSNLPTEESIHALIRMLADDNSDVVEFAKRSLLRLGSISESALVDCAINSENIKQKVHALITLDDMSAEVDKNDLTSLLTNHDKYDIGRRTYSVSELAERIIANN